MTAADIHAEVLGWVLDEIRRKSLGDEFGGAVAWAPTLVQIPGPGGRPAQAQIPVWHLLLTARNPIPAEGPLHHMGVLGAARPQEKTVRDEVIKGLRLLRELAASKLAPANGHPPAKAGRT